MSEPSKDLGNVLFPVFLKTQKLDTLIVGGKDTGLEKISFLFKHCENANVTLIAKTISEEVKNFAKHHPTLTLIERKFKDYDLLNRDILILATDKPDLNEKIHKKAKDKGILTNVADTPSMCDFYLGSVIKNGDLKIAISTNGRSPTVARRIRVYLEEMLGDQRLNDILHNLESIRAQIEGDFKEKVKRLNEITQNLVFQQKSKTDDER